MNKVKVGILGATGMVGQQFVRLLEGHPWFEVTAVAASGRSEGQVYGEACTWRVSADMPAAVREMRVRPCEPAAMPDCQLIFSALPGSVAGPIEEAFAAAGHFVSSNASSQRMTPDVPLLVPEVNPDHLALIDVQRRQRGWRRGFIVTNPNCTVNALVLALKPLHDRFGLRTVMVTTMQALSGAGYPGVPSLDSLDNVIPYIGGEEPKVESEPLKLLGRLEGGVVKQAPFTISAQCNRVATRDGHMESVAVAFEQPAPVEEVKETLRAFSGLPQELELPSAPQPPLVVREEPDRPQPHLDRDTGGGMAVVVGRVRPCPVLDVKFTLLGHNTVRGAAGAAILNAELLAEQGYLE
ncbi:MAG: aspartate-semialdehyde dehydrogenase [Chloroflexi bacterium]|nr:aspartate-semialdehyde dehydrogenase [Chloroflexota bacterium]